MADLSNSRGQNNKKTFFLSTNKRDMVDKAKCDVVSECVSLYHQYYYRETELLRM